MLVGEPRIVLPPRLVHETPLEAAGEASPTTSAQPRIFDLLDDPRVAFEDDIFCTVPVTTALQCPPCQLRGWWVGEGGLTRAPLSP